MPRALRAFVSLVVTLAMLSIAIGRQSGVKTEPQIEKLRVAHSAPRYWKDNLHTHSLWSDGDDFPEMIADWYKHHGYHFLTLSDHNVLSEGDRWVDVRPDHHNRPLALKKYLNRFGAGWVERRNAPRDKGGTNGVVQVRLKPLAEFRSMLEEPGKFLLIPGEELTHQFAKNPVHGNAINLRDVILPRDGRSVSETISVNLRAVHEQRQQTGWRTIAFLNHPNFGWGVKAEDMLTEELGYFEIFNGHPSVKNYGDNMHVSTEQMWDIALALRLGKHHLPIVYGLATDDAHRYHVSRTDVANPGRGWIMVKARFLTAESIVQAIEVGDFYCSTGVNLQDVRRQSKEISLMIQPDTDVKYKTQFIATMRGAQLNSAPRQDKEGKLLDVTRLYGTEVGKVVAESESLTPAYRFTGKEIYVRAKVISTKPHPNPYQERDVEVAWTQPFLP